MSLLVGRGRFGATALNQSATTVAAVRVVTMSVRMMLSLNVAVPTKHLELVSVWLGK